MEKSFLIGERDSTHEREEVLIPNPKEVERQTKVGVCLRNQ
jgi:hypothetical protein